MLLDSRKPGNSSAACLGCDEPVTSLISPEGSPDWVRVGLCASCYRKAELSPDKAVPPGVLIKKLMTEKNLSDNNLRKRIGCPKRGVERLYKGQARLDYLIAQALAGHLGYSIVFWLSLESEYRVRLKAENQKKEQKNAGEGKEAGPPERGRRIIIP